jgi:hypothetical protein
LSLVTVLKPQLAKIKVHKRVVDLNSTERRLNRMTAIILNPRYDKATKDKLLKEIVAESQVEKALKQRGVKL